MLKYALNTNILLHIWQLANIVPIPKLNKDIDKGTLYRPISILSVIADTEEEPFPYITANIPNTPTHHGNKTQHSTVTALHTVNNTVAKGFNQMAPPTRTITLALDISKAFDKINIYTLIRKLLQPKIPGTIIKSIANYIKVCRAYTTYRYHTSSERQFKTGVPQGGVLSPTLFNISTEEYASIQSTSSGHGLGRCHHHYIYTQARVHPRNTYNNTYIQFLPGHNKTISH